MPDLVPRALPDVHVQQLNKPSARASLVAEIVERLETTDELICEAKNGSEITISLALDSISGAEHPHADSLMRPIQQI